jgi:hypothetical protein
LRAISATYPGVSWRVANKWTFEQAQAAQMSICRWG